MDINKIDSLLSTDGIVFLAYGGFLSQALITGMTEALEKETEVHDVSMKVSTNIFTVFIELAQNMMNYSKQKNRDWFDSRGLMIVGYDTANNSYYVVSRNIVDINDKDRIEPRLANIEGLGAEELKSLYRELRKSGRDKHEKGAGIGFIEIARRCDKLEHYFTKLSEDSYYFVIKATVHNI